MTEGSGHFVKMIHNGVEYGLMQAYAEGFQVMKLSKSFPGMVNHLVLPDGALALGSVASAYWLRRLSRTS